MNRSGAITKAEIIIKEEKEKTEKTAAAAEDALQDLLYL